VSICQQPLFTLPYDERRLTDAQRTALEAIDKLGSIDTATAGEIVCRIRGRATCGVPYRRLLSDGYRALRRLQRLGLVHRRGDDLWERTP
jgi:hypothetical protein